MKSLLGTISLAGGLAASVSATGWWVLAARGRPTHGRGRLMLRLALACAALACALLVWALVTHDFSVRYVAENGARAVPLFYTVVSLWAALEGSLLLWLLVLTGMTVVAMRTVHPRAAALHPWAMAVLAGIGVFFFGLALFAGNAFEVVTPVPADGPGPNPLLQDHPLMAVHPPLLYLGYVGVSVPFAYAVAALLTGRTGRGWLIVTRRWTLAAWSFLTLGVVMGGWWSYEVLGWGGYWAWDPVENSSILPWFTATALLHSMMVQERRPMLRVWNLALATATFLLVLIGTFLTRSGVIASVHAFTQSTVGPALLGFIVVVATGVGALFVWRADRLGPDARLDTPVSREAVFLGNNVVLVGLAFTVLLGTVFPLLVEALNGQQVSVGAPYFNRMAVPLSLAMVLLMGVGPLVPWGTGDPRVLARRLWWPAAVGAVTVGGLGIAGLDGVGALLTFGLAAFVIATITQQFAAGARAARAATGRGRLAALGVAVARRRRLYGGLVVHAGVVLAAVAIAASSTYAVSAEQRLAIGESFTVGRYTATLDDIVAERTPRLMALRAEVRLTSGDRLLAVHEPALSFYPSMTQAIGTPSVETRLREDAYLTVTSFAEDRQSATIRLTLNPLVLWLWTAGGVMLAGATIAAWPSPRGGATPPPVSAAPARTRRGVER